MESILNRQFSNTIINMHTRSARVKQSISLWVFFLFFSFIYIFLAFWMLLLFSLFPLCVRPAYTTGFCASTNVFVNASIELIHTFIFLKSANGLYKNWIKSICVLLHSLSFDHNEKPSTRPVVGSECLPIWKMSDEKPRRMFVYCVWVLIFAHFFCRCPIATDSRGTETKIYWSNLYAR